MRRFAIILALLCAPAFAQAQVTSIQKMGRYVYRSSTGSYNILSGVALNASAGTRTIAVTTTGYDKITVCWQATRVAYTDVRVTPTCSVDNGATYSGVPSTSIATGVGTNTAYYDLLTVSASASLCYDYAVNNCSHMKFAFSGTSAGGSDLVTAQATAGVGR